MLSNEKYKGDSLLQKTYTVDFLSKKRVVNKGEVPRYYVEESHPAIIDKEIWEAVQLEMERRRAFAEKHQIQKDKGCESGHIDDKVLYQAFVNTINALVENRDQLIPKWQRFIEEDDVLKRITAKRFLAIFKTAEPLEEFDFRLYYKLLEKITVQNDGKLIATLHEGTEIECEIK